MDDLYAIGEDKGDVDKDGGHLPHARERGKKDLLWLALEDLADRRAGDALLGEHLLKDRRLENAEPDPQPNGDHDEAQPERDAPAPAEKLVARQLTERQDHKVGEEEAHRSAKL